MVNLPARGEFYRSPALICVGCTILLKKWHSSNTWRNIKNNVTFIYIGHSDVSLLNTIFLIIFEQVLLASRSICCVIKIGYNTHKSGCWSFIYICSKNLDICFSRKVLWTLSTCSSTSLRRPGTSDFLRGFGPKDNDARDRLLCSSS